jgi:hypothetical protein
MAKVIAFMGESRRERVLFEGELEDAQNFLRDNYPRIHIEPGMDYGEDGPPADAVVQDDDGARQFWNGRTLLDWRAPATASSPSNAVDSTNAQLADENARLRAQLAEAERRADRPQSDQSDASPVSGQLPSAGLPGESGESVPPDDVRAALDAHRQQGDGPAESVATASGEPASEGQ